MAVRVFGPEILAQRLGTRLTEQKHLKLVQQPKILVFPGAAKPEDDFDRSFLTHASHELPLSEVLPADFFLHLLEDLKPEEFKEVESFAQLGITERISRRLELVQRLNFDLTNKHDQKLRDLLLVQLREDFKCLCSTTLADAEWNMHAKALIKTIRRFPGITEGKSSEWLLSLREVGAKMAIAILKDIEMGICDWRDIPKERYEREIIKQIESSIKKLRGTGAYVFSISDEWDNLTVELAKNIKKAKMVRTILDEAENKILDRTVITPAWLNSEADRRMSEGLPSKEFVKMTDTLNLGSLVILDRDCAQSFVKHLVPANISALISTTLTPEQISRSEEYRDAMDIANSLTQIGMQV